MQIKTKQRKIQNPETSLVRSSEGSSQSSVACMAFLKRFQRLRSPSSGRCIKIAWAISEPSISLHSSPSRHWPPWRIITTEVTINDGTYMSVKHFEKKDNLKHWFKCYFCIIVHYLLPHRNIHYITQEISW